jgi:signal transduction histidine kinase/ActR/RegA family two-component response regulator
VERLHNSFDPAWAQANVGGFVTQSVEFSEIHVLDASDRPVFSAARDGQASYEGLRAAAAPLLERLRGLEARRGPIEATGRSAVLIAPPIQVSDLVATPGGPAYLIVSLVQPSFGAALPRGPRAAALLAVRPIDSGWVRSMSERYFVDDLHFADLSARAAPGEAETIARDGLDRPVFGLRWTPRRPGSELLDRIFWPVLMTVVALALLIILTQQAVRRAFAELVDSREALKSALTTAEAADRAKSEFLAAISHEIRTPLNSVLGAMHLLRSEPVSAEGKVLIENAVSSGRMVNALINDVLDYSKIAAGRMELSPDATDLRALFESVRASFAPECDSKGLTLDLDVRPEVGWALIDELRLRQCLFNLVGNAVKFTSEGTIRITAGMAAGDLTVEVQDTGPGIAEEVLPTLFARFTQGDGSTTRRFGGAGLGLAITRQLARLMGGDVDVRSRLGEGAAFTLRISAPAAAAAAAPAFEAEPGADAPLAGLRLLLVDDNPANLTIGTLLLERMGAAVTTADTGRAALERCTSDEFDLVLMDIQMPEMDGLETTRRLRRRAGPTARAPVIAVTANVLDSQRAAYAEAGMSGVVAKPISPAELLAEIVRVANAQAPERPAAA